MRTRRTERVRLAPVLRRIAVCIALLAGLQPIPDPRAQAGPAGERWVGTWSTGLVGRASTGGPQRAAAPGTVISGRTLRQVVRASVGGTQVRIVLSNAFGTSPVAIGAAHVARRGHGAQVVSGSGRGLTFSGSASTTIAAGAVAVSDPVDLSLPHLADVAIDLYLPGDLGGSSLTIHNGARQTNYISEAGNHAGASEFPVSSTTTSWFFLSRVEVANASAAGAIVAIGDSITDGYGSTVDANSRWPDHLARRLLERDGGTPMGVLNVGIDGNRLLADGMGVSALARFDRDVLVQTGATHVIVLEGINDLGLTREGPRPTATDLIAAHRQLIARARARGLTVIGGTLLPYEGTKVASFADYYTPEGDAARREFNTWMRSSGEYDAVIDFDRALRDPDRPAWLLAEYDSGDHLHPGDAGYRAMGAAVDLALLERMPAAARRLSAGDEPAFTARWWLAPGIVSSR